jgi:hypothetical protein
MLIHIIRRDVSAKWDHETRETEKQEEEGEHLVNLLEGVSLAWAHNSRIFLRNNSRRAMARGRS